MTTISQNDFMSLEWHPVENDIPPACNNCGGQVKAGGYHAEIEITEDSAFMLVMCSENCKHIFLNHPASLDYVNGNLAVVQ